jgi:hypothetical protein
VLKQKLTLLDMAQSWLAPAEQALKNAETIESLTRWTGTKSDNSIHSGVPCRTRVCESDWRGTGAALAKLLGFLDVPLYLPTTL